MLQGPERTIKRSRKLRSEMSLPEVLLWKALRARPEGLKFRRQHPSGPFTADFFCHEASLAIEIDGIVHEMGKGPERDIARDTWFAARGISVYRVTARDVLGDLDSVLTGITNIAQNRSALNKGPPPIPPLDGEIEN